MKPVLTVMMPAFNAEKTIRIAVRSALLSMPINSELIIFLDGCTDGTFQKVEKIKDARIKILNSDRNIGILKSRETLLQQATADIVANLDADDICLPWRFRHQLRAIEREQADILFSNAVLFGKLVNKIGFRIEMAAKLDKNLAKISLLFSNPFINSSMIARKKSLLDLGGFESAVEDFGLWLKASTLNANLVRTSAICILYRVHSSQITRTSAWQKKEKIDPVLRDLKNAHLDSLSNGFDGQTPDDVRKTLWKRYSMASNALIVQNYGLKKLAGTIAGNLFKGIRAKTR